MFHETRFPTAISKGAQGGPERRTDVVTLGSGFEERNSRWADSRRRYNAGYGLKSLNDIHAVLTFFEERRGRLYGFRWRDQTDWKSCPPESNPTAVDQDIGTGDGDAAVFQLSKVYGASYAPWRRDIFKPIASSVKVAVNGTLKNVGVDVLVDETTGRLTFQPAHIPPLGVTVTAGFEFDVPVRFDTDKLEIDVEGVRHGAIPSIPLVEIRLETAP